MLGAGTFVSAIIRVVSTVAILAAVYLFIVRPVLDTTENVTNQIGHAVNPAVRSAQRALRRSGVDPAKISHQVKVSVAKTAHHVNVSGLPKDVRRILACIQRAGGNVNRIQACQT